MSLWDYKSEILNGKDQRMTSIYLMVLELGSTIKYGMMNSTMVYMINGGNIWYDVRVQLPRVCYFTWDEATDAYSWSTTMCRVT